MNKIYERAVQLFNRQVDIIHHGLWSIDNWWHGDTEGDKLDCIRDWQITDEPPDNIGRCLHLIHEGTKLDKVICSITCATHDTYVYDYRDNICECRNTNNIRFSPLWRYR